MAQKEQGACAQVKPALPLALCLPATMGADHLATLSLVSNSAGWDCSFPQPSDMPRMHALSLSGLCFLSYKTGNNDGTSDEDRCEGGIGRAWLGSSAPGSLGREEEPDGGGVGWGGMGALEGRPLGHPLPRGPSETKGSPRAPPCGGGRDATQRSHSLGFPGGGGEGVLGPGLWRDWRLSRPWQPGPHPIHPDSPLLALGQRWG